MHGGITFEPHQLGNLNRTRLAGTTEVVTQQVDDHHVLGPVLVAAHEFRGEICILFGVAMARPGAFDRPGLYGSISTHLQKTLRGR